jgi:hypothetical protein
MYNISENAMVEEKSDRLYEMLLLLYPEPYRIKFGREMLYTFRDMRDEERTKHGMAGVVFWSTILFDTLLSAVHEHREAIRKDGMKKYLHRTPKLNNYNLVSLILLLPFLLMAGIDLISRILQGDLFHYNRAAYAAVSQTPLYWYPILFTWVILFPILAIIISLIPLAMNGKKMAWPGIAYLRQNPGSVILITVAALLLAMVKLHDFVPCLVHNISMNSFRNIPSIISLCRKA